MNDDENHLISVKILDRSYQIKCPPDQTQALQEAASYIDQQMKKFKQNAQVNNTERVAIITALNISHELMQLRKQKNNYIDVMNQRIQDLQHRIENFIAASEEVGV